MDNCWQRKCGPMSMLQSTSYSPLISSSLPDSHSQFLDAGQNFYSCIPQDSISLGNQAIQQPGLPWASNSNVVNSSPTEFSGSFISFLSGPLPPFQGELQHSSNSNCVFTLNEKPINCKNANGSASGNGPVLVPAVELSQHFSSRHFKAGETLKPIAVIDSAKREMARPAVPSHYVGNEKIKHSSFPRGTTGLISDSSVTFNDIPDRMKSKQVFPETGSSGQLWPSIGGHPRVFCLGISGYLLLRNPGFLGVICLCHGSHMSLSRFCEHSGLSNVNPGNAVHMESGVTIAQWRRVFFQKLGIRAPEDHGGWDWPEVLPVGTGLGEFYPSHNCSLNSELFGAFGATGGAGQSWNNLSISKSPPTSQEEVDISVQNVKQTSEDSRKLTFCGSISTSKSRLFHETDMELTSCSNPHRLTSSNLDGIQGPENGSSFISACIGSNSKDANTFNSVPDFKFSKSLGINSSLMQMDRSSISSNIELRLGHSSQQSKKLGTLAQPDYECHTIVKPTENQQSLFPEPFMHKVVESQAMEEGKSSFHMFNLSPSSGKGQLDLVNSAYGVHKVSSESRNRNSAFPMLQAHFNGASEGMLYSEATKNRVNGSYIPPEEPHCESLTLKCDQINFNCARGNITNREFNIDTSCDLGHGNNDKGVSNNFYSSTELNFGLYCKYNETKFKRVVEGIGPSNCLALNEKNFYPCKPHGMITDMHDSQNTLNLYGNASLISHNGPFDKSNVKSVCKPKDAIAAPPTQAVPLGFPLSSSTLIRNQTLQSSNRASLNERQIEVTKNPQMQTLHHGLRLSIPAPGSSSTATTKEHVLRRNPFDKAPTSINRLYESDVANTRNASKFAELSAFFGVSDYMAKRTQTIAPIIDQLEGCNVDPSHGGSLRPHDSQLHCQLSTDFNAVYWPHVRHGCSESNFSQSVKQAKCFQEAPNSFMSSHCSCAVQPDTSVEKHHFVGEPLHITPRERKGISGCIKKNISACKLDDSHKFALKKVAFSEENSDLMGHKINKMEFHSSQWRDVPKKVTGPVSLTCKEQTSSFLNMNDKMSGQNADSDANKPYCDVAFQNIECLKESEMSTVSSGGSTPVVSDGSSVIHDKDISTADGQNNVVSNVIVDEGSGIDRSWSSNDAQGSEQSAEFFCVASGFNPVDAGPSKKFVDNSSRSLIDEIRLRDSLRLKKMQKQSSFGIQEMSHCVQKEADICKKVLRKRTKWRKLDTTFPASAFYCACSYPGGNCGAWLQCSCKDKEGISQYGIGSAEECSRSFEPSSRERRFRMRLLRTLSCNSKVNCEGAKTIFTQSDILKSGDDDTFGTCELPRRKRPKLDTVSSVKQIDEGDNLGDEAAGKCSLVECTVSSEMHDKIYRRVVRPIVWGKYGVISNGNPSRPVKFGSLKTICDSLAKCSSTGKCTTKSTSVKCRKASANEKHRRINKSLKLKKAGICNAPRVITAKKSKSHILTSNELDLCRSLEQSRRANCHGGEQGTGLLYPLEKRRYDCVVKTGDIADGFLPSLQKSKSKEIHKQSLYEFTLEGIYPGEGTLTCARTEGYKGRKKEGVRYNFPHHSELGGGCLVAQEQLNAWIHITGQKSSRKEILRLPPKDAEYDYRKEYAHYKHSKGWKSLVVYKSGIHALGLYTSRFISQGEMVVEYVGEIVGLRVSDKRENEYLSGKKLQYKSACYFFRIDQEHIVDATQKGGIARFVNHSCQPNCVAKIISVRNDKKVVFFAERDIYPGEEITYDYNFNHEDEGKKIPCYCNSKNCRQYLN